MIRTRKKKIGNLKTKSFSMFKDWEAFALSKLKKRFCKHTSKALTVKSQFKTLSNLSGGTRHSTPGPGLSWLILTYSKVIS